MRSREGVGLIELIVALTLLSVGVLGLVGSAIIAQRSFTRAAAVETSARAAAALIDSLMHEPAPTAGARQVAGLRMSWSVSSGDGLLRVTAVVEAPVGETVRRTTWSAARAQ